MPSKKLSDEAEKAIIKHNKQITDRDRELLSKMNNDPDRQTKWIMSPFIQWIIEGTINGSSCHNSTTSTVVSTNSTNNTNTNNTATNKNPPKTVYNEPTQVPEPEQEVEPSFSLFD